MTPAPILDDELARLDALYGYGLLDSAPDAELDRLTRLAARLTGSEGAMISLVDAGRQWALSRHGAAPVEIPRELSFCAHAVAAPGRPLVVEDAARDPRFAGHPMVAAGELLSYAGIPLIGESGHALGALCVTSPAARSIPAETIETLAVLAQAVMTAIELRRAVRQLRLLALTDVLTGLPNRQALLDSLARAIARQRRDGTPFSLLYLDLDGFKAVNDREGHAAGDRALALFAEVLRATLRTADAPARIGGDEFAAVIEGTAEAALPVAERLRAATEAAMRARGWPITASIGVAAFPVPPEDPARALSAADAGMYAAKSAGKNRVSAATCLSG